MFSTLTESLHLTRALTVSALCGLVVVGCWAGGDEATAPSPSQVPHNTVSYTHLTLPTKRIV